MRIKNTIILSLALAVMLCAVSCAGSHGEYYQKYLQYKDFFGAKIYSAIDYQCSEEKKAEVRGHNDIGKTGFFICRNRRKRK